MRGKELHSGAFSRLVFASHQRSHAHKVLSYMAIMQTYAPQCAWGFYSSGRAQGSHPWCMHGVCRRCALSCTACCMGKWKL